MELRPIPRQGWSAWYSEELCTSFPACERKPLAAIEALADAGKYELLGFYEGAALLGYAALWHCPERPDYVLLDYLGVTAVRRNSGLGGEILRRLAVREAGRRTVLIEAEEEHSGGPEEERPIRLRRLAFYTRNGCTPVYGGFNCGLLCQVFVLGPAPAVLEPLKEAHRAIYGRERTDVVIDPPPGGVPEPPYWLNQEGFA